MCSGHPSEGIVARPSHSFQDIHSSLLALYQNWKCHGRQVSVFPEEIAGFYHDTSIPWQWSGWQHSCIVVNQMHPWRPWIERAQTKLTLKRLSIWLNKKNVCCISSISVTFMQLSEYWHQYNIYVVFCWTVILCKVLQMFQKDLLPSFSTLNML